MADIAFGVAGAYVGSFFGMPGLGYSIGAAVGGSLFGDPIKTKGPRIKDLRVQTAQDGTPIPIIYGTSRIPGYVKWSTGLIEKKHTDSSGGKGGPGQEHTRYTYKASFAVGLCEGEIQGVRKIWADGRLIYNIAEDAQLDIETEAVSGAIDDLITVYTGSTTQDPDPVIEAWAAVGDVPAWRGEAYIVFENLQLGKYGNRIPNIEVEVVGVGTEASGDNNFYAVKQYYGWDAAIKGRKDPRSAVAIAAGGYKYTYGGTDYTSLEAARAAAQEAVGYALELHAWSFDGQTVNWLHNTDATDHLRLALHFNIPLPNWGDVPYYETLDTFNDDIGQVEGAYAWAAYRTNQGTGNVELVHYHGDGWDDEHPAETGGGCGFAPNGNLVCPRYIKDTRITVEQIPACPDGDCDCSTIDIEFGLVEAGLCDEVPLPENDNYCVNLHTGDIRRRLIYSTAVSGEYHALQMPIIDGTYNEGNTPTFGTNGFVTQLPMNPVLPVGDDDDTQAFWQAEQLAASPSPSGSFTWPVTANSPSTWDTVNPDLVDAAVYQDHICVAPWGQHTLDPDPITLDVIVADLTERSGLTSADYDVTELASTLVWGYAIDRPMSAREALTPLIAAYHFYGVESDGIIKYKLKNQSSLVTITEDELDTRSYGTSPGAALRVTRQQELEIPRRVRVQFQDFANDHQIGQEYALRQTVDSEAVEDVQLAITMYPSQAAVVADVLLRERWLGRTSYDLSVPRDYLYLDPGDIITVTQGNASHLIRVLHTEYLGGKVKLKGVAHDATLFDSFATGDDTDNGQVISGLISGPTYWGIVDTAAVDADDNNAGYYVGMNGVVTGWQGGTLQRSDDSGATWADLVSSESAQTWGLADATIADGGVGTYDRGTQFNVTLYSGSLSSTTEANLLAGGNLCAVGDVDRWELLQFRDATLNADGTYTLSHLLRGRYGTEWATSTHADKNYFVLMDSAIQRYSSGSDRIDKQAAYRAVSYSTAAQGALTALFTPRGVGLEPFAPVHLKATRSGNDVTLTWLRRSRLPSDWADYVDVPLNEDSESYEVDVYDAAGTFIETVAADLAVEKDYSASITYTSAATVQLIVYQLSATVGRGYASETVTI